MIDLLRTNSDNEDFRKLIFMLDQELHGRYGDLQHKLSPFNKIVSNNNVVIALIDSNSVGCGCFRIYDKYTVEIKRMFVAIEFRGRGISKMILQELESWAIEIGFEQAILETGIEQPEAIGLYTKSGYVKTGNYGDYAGLETSFCMIKKFALLNSKNDSTETADRDF
jgi:putative acetyltransferase